jgi:hypothetical protein
MKRFLALVPVLLSACSSSRSPDAVPAGSNPGAGGGAPTGSCATLATCCTKAPSADQASCNTIASNGDLSACSANLSTFQAAGYCAVGSYPPGPYGMQTGMTFPELSLQGYVGGTGPWTTIDLEDYFDPDGSRGIAGLYLTGSAPWCAACQAEGQGFPELYASKYKSEGARFLTALVEDVSHAPATQATVDAWILANHTNYDIAADPSFSVLPMNEQGGGSVALPYNYVIDPRTMRVVQINSGPFLTGGTVPGLDALLQRNAKP